MLDSWIYAVQEWSYLRGGLSTLDRDYGVFNKIHHDIGTHVVHHLLPQIPHYNLCEATEAVKPVMGEYYRCGMGMLTVWVRCCGSCPNIVTSQSVTAACPHHGAMNVCEAVHHGTYLDFAGSQRSQRAQFPSTWCRHWSAACHQTTLSPTRATSCTIRRTPNSGQCPYCRMHLSFSDRLHHTAADHGDDDVFDGAAGPQFVSESSARRRQRQPTCKTAAPHSSWQTSYHARACGVRHRQHSQRSVNGRSHSCGASSSHGS